MTDDPPRDGDGADTLRPSLLPFDPADLVALRVLPAEFARIVGVSKQTVSRWIREGKVTLGPDGRLDPAKASRQVLQTSDPARIRARVFKSAMESTGELREKATRAEAALRAAEERLASVEAALRAAEERLASVEAQLRDVFGDWDAAEESDARQLDCFMAALPERIDALATAHDTGCASEWLDLLYREAGTAGASDWIDDDQLPGQLRRGTPLRDAARITPESTDEITNLESCDV